jgi:hypothetical protein
MRIIDPRHTRARVWFLPAAVLGGFLAGRAPGGPPVAPAPRPIDSRFAPYAADPDHPWNRLHQALFVRHAADGGRRVHTTDPLLYESGTFLLAGESHRRVVTLLDQFLARPGDRTADDPLKRLFLQRDLWATFDYAARYPDEWVFTLKDEPAAIALRNRLAKAVGLLALFDREIAALPDNYALAVKAKQYATAYDPKHPERSFLPPDLFDPAGPWVRFHESTGKPMAEQHFKGAGGRAAHVVFLRLPAGRAATEQYLKDLTPGEPYLEHPGRDSVKQFPPGTMVAMVRCPLAVDTAAKVRVTPVTELVQIRVYRRIPKDPEANFHSDFGEQDVYEFVLDRAKLFAGESGLRAVGPGERAEEFGRRGVDDPFEEGPRRHRARELDTPQLKTCIQCHQAPGVYSVLSMDRGLRAAPKGARDIFRTYAWDVELGYTVKAKVGRYDWGLLQGKLEAK